MKLFPAPKEIFTYQYTIAGDSAYLETGESVGLASNLSHWILEVSPGASIADFQDLNPPSSEGIKNWEPGQGNEGMPANLYGIRWEAINEGGTAFIPFSVFGFLFSVKRNKQLVA